MATAYSGASAIKLVKTSMADVRSVSQKTSAPSADGNRERFGVSFPTDPGSRIPDPGSRIPEPDETSQGARMRSLITTVAVVLTAVVAFGQGPGPAAPTGPAPTGLVVGSGNFFSPIVSDLEKATAFYGQGLGLELPATASNADANLPLRQMFGLPDAHLRWMIGRPGTARGGVEIIEP